MATFVDVHHGFFGVTEPQLRELQERDLAVEQSEGVHFRSSWLDPERGTLFCLSTAPSRECVFRVHERAGHPPAEVYEIDVELDTGLGPRPAIGRMTDAVRTGPDDLRGHGWPLGPPTTPKETP